MDTKDYQVDDFTITLPSKTLRDALRKLKAVTRENPPASAYAHVKMDVRTSGQLFLTAGCDYQKLDMELTGVQYDGVSPRGLMAPELAPLLDSLNAMPDTLVWLTERKGKIRMESSISKVDIPLIDPTTYPEPKWGKADPWIFQLTGEQATELSRALTRCQKFATKNEFKKFLSGIWIKEVAGKLTLEATDELNATIMSVDIVSSHSLVDTMIPIESVAGVADALIASASGAELTISKRWVQVDCGSVSFSCRLMDEKPVGMAALFPMLADMDVTWTEDRSVVKGLLSRITALPGTPTQIGQSKGGQHVARLNSNLLSYSSQMGDYSIDQPIEGWDGPDLSWACGVNCQKFGTFLTSLSSDELVLYLDSTGKRRCIYVEGPGHRTLLMINSL